MNTFCSPGCGARTPPPGEQKVFISYPSERIDQARRVADALVARQVPVWLDKRELGAGQFFQTRILDGIRRAALFVPVLSTAVRTDANRFFFREWRYAVEHARGFGAEREFIVPCVIDDVRPIEEPRIEAALRESIHIVDVTTDEGLARFVDDVQALYRQLRLTREDRG
jgi:hypothetical protein